MRVLVVGVGFMGALHARTVRGLRWASVCGVVDRVESVAGSVGVEVDAPSFTDLDQAIEQTAPDAAIVATPDPAHREPVEVLIRAGVPVLVEKPLATALEDAEAMVDMAEKSDVRLMTGHLGRFHPRYALAADHLRLGRFGKPLLVTTSTWGRKSLGARVADVTNPLWHFAIHDLDALQWVTGGVIEEVLGAQFVESGSGVCTFAGTGRLSNGAGFHVAAGWTLPDTAGPRFDLKVHCEEGVVQAAWSGDGLSLYTSEAAVDEDCIAWPTLHGQVDGALRREVEHFLTALATGEPFLVTPQQAVDAVRGAALLQHAAERRTIT